MGVKYGIVIKLTEELLKTMFAKELLKAPNELLTEAVKCITLANFGVPVNDWNKVECEVTRDCLTDTYLFRLRSFSKVEGLYEMKIEGTEYHKRPLKGNYDD